VCVHGQSTKNNLIALVVPDEIAAKKWAKENGVEQNSMEELVRNKEFRKEILDQVIRS
jgi:long-subunit acyl-CoA synthetase (AMP-forming)